MKQIKSVKCGHFVEFDEGVFQLNNKCSGKATLIPLTNGPKTLKIVELTKKVIDHGEKYKNLIFIKREMPF